jgi:hypothetical protein
LDGGNTSSSSPSSPRDCCAIRGSSPRTPDLRIESLRARPLAIAKTINQPNLNGNQGFFNCRRLDWARALETQIPFVALSQVNVAVEGLPSCLVATIQRVVSDAHVEVQIVLVPDGIVCRKRPLGGS